MHNFGAQAPLKRDQKALSTIIFECADIARALEVAGFNFAGIDHGNHHRVGQNRPEWLHDIQGQRHAAVSGLVIKAAKRIEADRAYDALHLAAAEALMRIVSSKHMRWFGFDEMQNKAAVAIGLRDGMVD